MAAFLWQTEVSDGFLEEMLVEDSGLEFAPRRPCSRGPGVAATRRDCQGSAPEPEAFSPGLAMRDLGVCVSEYLRGLLAARRPLGPQEVVEDVCTREPERQISTLR